MNCWRCNDTMPDGARFCIACGAEIAAPQTTRLNTGKTERLQSVGVAVPNEEYNPPLFIGSADLIYGGTIYEFAGPPYVISMGSVIPLHSGTWASSGSWPSSFILAQGSAR